MYTVYECLECRIIFIMVTDQVREMKAKGKYIACNFGHKRVKELDQYDNINDAIKHNSYRRVNGKIVQMRWCND